MKTLAKTVVNLTLLAGAMAVSAWAIPANGSVPFSLLSVSVNTPGALVPHTQFTIGSIIASGNGSGSFDTCPSPDCVASGSAATITSPFFGDVMTGIILIFGPGGRYHYTVTSQLAPDITHIGQNTTDNIFTLGTFQDTLVGGFDNAAASVVFAFTESCSGTAPCSESGSATFATPPVTLGTPEPTTMLLAGGALLGVGCWLGRRRVPKR